jgi:hypothetical protein
MSNRGRRRPDFGLCGARETAGTGILRSPYWYIRGSIRGLRVDESTGLSDERAAQELLARRAAQVLDRAIHGESASRTFAEAPLAIWSKAGNGTIWPR